ncbi:MAG TPA: acyl-CoA dehydrogenase family protein [Mycobacteriales bacterium]|nr:acyl-CoA dehydrogenase family protein [Mycobacteriales bacterium]
MSDELASVVRRVLADAGGTGHARAAYGEARGAGDAAWKALASTGVVGLLAPDSGAGMREVGTVCGELGAVASPLPYISSAVGALSLLPADDPWAARIAEGDAIGVPALLEPKRGYDLTPAATVSGDRITGEKVHVVDAGAADVLLVTAGDGVWAVAPGDVEVVAGDSTDGSRPEARVVLRDAPGTRVAGLDVVARAVDRLRAALVADAVGSARAAFQLALDYSKVREQFGVAVGSFQAVQTLLVDVMRDVETSAVTGRNALDALDDPEVSPDERHRAVLLAKAQSADVLPRALESCIQVHGGIGFTWEHDVGLHYKRALSLAAAYGDATSSLAALADLVV